MSEKRVYWVDDDQKFIDDGIPRLSKHADVEVVLQAHSVREASTQIPDKVLASKANLVFLDHELPDGTGNDVLELLIKAGINLPVIALASRHESKMNYGDFRVSKASGPAKLIDTIKSISVSR